MIPLSKTLEELAECASPDAKWEKITLGACIAMNMVAYAAGMDESTLECCQFDDTRTGIRYARSVGHETMVHVLEMWILLEHGWITRSYWIRTFEVVTTNGETS